VSRLEVFLARGGKQIACRLVWLAQAALLEYQLLCTSDHSLGCKGTRLDAKEPPNSNVGYLYDIRTGKASPKIVSLTPAHEQ